MSMPAGMKTGADEQASQPESTDGSPANAKLLSKQPEVFRSELVTEELAVALATGHRSAAEIFQAVYGDASGREYWHAQLSEPIAVFKFARVLAVHVAECANQLEPTIIAIIRAFRDAAEAGEDWLVADTTPLLTLENRDRSFGSLRKVKVHPRRAIFWLLSKPKRKHLVPDTLRRFLQLDEVSGRRRSLSKREAERLTDDYFNGEQRQGRRPTLGGLEKFAKKAGFRGGREYLRAAFRRRIEPRRGRPRKSD
jgi:hypothetical protein